MFGCCLCLVPDTANTLGHLLHCLLLFWFMAIKVTPIRLIIFICSHLRHWLWAFFFLPRSSFPLLGVKLDVAQHLKISHKLCNHKESLKACDILVISQRLDVRFLLTWFRLLLNGFPRWKQFGNSALPLLLLNHRVRSALAAYPSVAILRNTEPTPVIWPTPIPPYTGTLAGWSNVSLWHWTVPGCSHQRSVQ